MNRSQKGDRDAADWVPVRHGRWFAEQVIAVKLAYGLSVDPAERDALQALLAGADAELNCVDADTTSPTVAISSDAIAPVTGAFAIAVTFSEPVTGFALEDVVVGNGSASRAHGCPEGAGDLGSRRRDRLARDDGGGASSRSRAVNRRVRPLFRRGDLRP